MDVEHPRISPITHHHTCDVMKCEKDAANEVWYNGHIKVYLCKDHTELFAGQSWENIRLLFGVVTAPGYHPGKSEPG